jgi:hypothetical protein
VATATAPFLDRALPLLARGFSVIPITPGQKNTLPGIGALSRTRDVDTVQGWATKFPDANVAIVADQDICILESDDFGQLKQLVKNGTGKDIPETLMSCGSSPDRPHLFFRHNAKNSKNVGCLAVPGLFECRFSNQYVAAAGSIHPNGSTYWFLNDAAVVEIPDWLVAELVRLAMTQKTDRRNPTAPRGLDGKIVEGGRHYELFRELGRQWTGEQEFEDLLEWARDWNATNCEPPMDDWRVVNDVRDIMKRAPFDPGPAVVLGSKAKTEGEQTEPRLKALTIRQLREQVRTLNSLEELVQGILPVRSVNIIGGDSGLGKSPLMCQLAVCVAAGIPFLGHTVKKSSVLIVDYENDSALLPMLEATAKAVNAPDTVFEDGLFILQRPEQSEILRTVADTGARLVVVDSLRGLDSQAESAKSGRGAQLISELQDVDCCWLLIHHLRKQHQSAEAPRPNLEDENLPVLTWLENLSGSRALVNQTFTRIGIDHTNRQAAELVIRGYFKGKGQFGPFFLSRIYDDSGEPLGYEKLTGAGMLTLNQKADLQKVLAAGPTLAFNELADLLGKSTASRFLGVCKAAGIVTIHGQDQKRAEI